MKYLLIAKLENGTYFSLAERYSKEHLTKLKQTTTFYCPVCHGKLTMKLGNKKQWHFAHQIDKGCSDQFENETDYHLKGKMELYRWLLTEKEVEAVYLEKYIKTIKQRPDILVKIKQQWIALEFQCSPLPSLHHQKRTQSYLQANILPIWIIGGTRLKRKGKYSFALNDFEWNCLSPPTYPMQPQIFYFCPETMRVIVLNAVISVSPTKAYARLKTYSLPTFSIKQILDNDSSQEERTVWQDWLTLKKVNRYEHARYPNQAQRYFQTMLVKNNTYPSLFPIEAGWPTRNHHWIETPFHIWQSWILLEFLPHFHYGQSFTFQALLTSFRSTYSIYHIRLFSTHHGHFSFALMSYLLLLCRLQVIKRASSSTFVRLQDGTLPQTIEQAIELDEKLARRIMAESRNSTNIKGEKMFPKKKKE